MGSKAYAKLLRDPRWQLKRLEIIERDHHCKCGALSYLQVHHIRYIRGKMPWDYPNELLILLCRSCHKKEHWKLKAEARAKRKIAKENKLKKLSLASK